MSFVRLNTGVKLLLVPPAQKGPPQHFPHPALTKHLRDSPSTRFPGLHPALVSVSSTSCQLFSPLQLISGTRKSLNKSSKHLQVLANLLSMDFLAFVCCVRPRVLVETKVGGCLSWVMQVGIQMSCSGCDSTNSQISRVSNPTTDNKIIVVLSWRKYFVHPSVCT